MRRETGPWFDEVNRAQRFRSQPLIPTSAVFGSVVLLMLARLTLAERIQFYRRQVSAMLVTKDFQVRLDVEEQRKGEDEVCVLKGERRELIEDATSIFNLEQVAESPGRQAAWFVRPPHSCRISTRTVSY